MLDKRIKFDERYDRSDGTTVLWFIVPKELLPKEYPEAESMELSLEFPTHDLIAQNAIAEFSPTKCNLEGDGTIDYDWNEIDIPLEEIEELIKLAENHIDKES